MITSSELNEAYRQMAQDEHHEAKALEWAEATLGDAVNEPMNDGGKHCLNNENKDVRS